MYQESLPELLVLQLISDVNTCQIEADYRFSHSVGAESKLEVLPLDSPLSVQLIRSVNPLKPELNPICYLLALLAHHFPHVSRIRVKSLTIRLLISYIYGAPILDVSRSHTTTQHSR